MSFKEISDKLVAMVDVLESKKAVVIKAQSALQAAAADYERAMEDARSLHEQHRAYTAEALPSLNASQRR